MRVALMLRVAAPFVWSTEIRDAAAVLDLPDHIVEPYEFQSPVPAMWWTWPEPIEVDIYGVISRTVVSTASIEGVLVYQVTGGPGGLEVYRVGWMGDQPCVRHDTIIYGDRFPEDSEGVGDILSMLAFLRAPFVEAKLVLSPSLARRSGGPSGSRQRPTSFVSDARTQSPMKTMAARVRPLGSGASSGSSGAIFATSGIRPRASTI